MLSLLLITGLLLTPPVIPLPEKPMAVGEKTQAVKVIPPMAQQAESEVIKEQAPIAKRPVRKQAVPHPSI